MAFRIPGETAAQSRFRQRMERAQQAQEEHEHRRHEVIIRQIERREHQEELRRWKERMTFELYLTAGKLLDRLMAQRDRNVPGAADEQWNESFREAVSLIPEAKMFLEEMSIDMTDRFSKGGGAL